MCGINGIIKLNNSHVFPDEIKAMNNKIIHRGPDHQGIYTYNNVGLGHTRLSIVDLSSRSNQPFIYQHAGRKIILTYNGEIYNFKDIRQNLLTYGFVFNTTSDTEVLAAAYMKYGKSCLDHFNGMFAFALYDPDQQIIFAARDRFGQKPFKYYFDGNQFIFSSELKAILTNHIAKKVDYDAVINFLAPGYVSAPQTGFDKINKLPNAHYLILNIKNRQLTTQRYYDIDFSKKLILSETEWQEIIEKKLIQAIKKCLITDVPLGAFLSGGLDSSSIVALMSRFISKLQTFSIKFAEKRFDESIYARKIAQLYNTNHHEFQVTETNLLESIDDLIKHYEEPYGDSSQLPTFFLSKMTKKYVTVALGGDGGDENFGGYSKYSSHLLTKKFAPFFIAIKPFFPLLKKINSITPSDKLEKLSIVSQIINKSIAQRHFNYIESFSDSTINWFLNTPLPVNKNIFEELIGDKKFSDMDKVYYLDFNAYLPNDINVKVDMASMYHALEVRSPFLDHDLVNLTAQIPWQLKTGFWSGKKIFKKTMEKYLPRQIIYRKKQGFGVPLAHWFRGPLKNYVRETITAPNSLTAEIISQKNLDKILQSHQSKISDHTSKIWNLFVLNHWHKHYFKQ